MDKVDSFMIDKQNKLENSIGCFLPYLCENNTYRGPEIDSFFCIHDNESLFFVRNNTVEQITIKELVRLMKNNLEKIRRKSDVLNYAMGLMPTYNFSDYVRNYFSLKFNYEYCSASEAFTIEIPELNDEDGEDTVLQTGVITCFCYHENNSFLSYVLSAYGDTWIQDGMGKLTNTREPFEIMTTAITSANSNIIDFSLLTNISSLNYEGEKCRSFLGFSDMDNIKDEITFEINHDIKFIYENSKQIRKLLQLTGESYCLLVDYNTDPYVLRKAQNVYGVGSIKGLGKLNFYARINGYLNWTFYEQNNKAILKYINGTYMLPGGEENQDDLLGKVTNNIRKISPCDVDLSGIIQGAYGQLHGTTIIITDVAEKEAQRLSQANRGYSISLNGQPIDLKNDDIKIKNITNIDGAIILDFEGRCWAIGVILDGEACVSGDPSRGARFNSAKNYIALKKRKNNDLGKTEIYVAVIISEDRYVDVFTTDVDYKYI